MTIGRLPFVPDVVPHANPTQQSRTLYKKILNGLVTKLHQQDLACLSIFCRSLIKRCLDTDKERRITALQICQDPFILMGNRLSYHINSCGVRPIVHDEENILIMVKDTLRVSCSTAVIMEHIKVHYCMRTSNHT